jgi:flagellar biosynthesis/type III secretory pathway M-ring protein FliF/YscJ
MNQPTMPTMPAIPTTGAPDWIGWVIGSLIFVIVVLAIVIIYLFKLYLARTKGDEKQCWDAEKKVEIQKLELEYEQRAKELAQEYIRQGAHDREQALAREEQTRVYNAELHEKIAEKNETSRTMMVELLQKIQMRITGRARTKGGS